MKTARLQVRAGVAVSVALPFDGDDYLGRGANFAARICDAANEGEVLCDIDCKDHIPKWILKKETRTVDVRGMGIYEVLVLVRA
jgi:class 3 adenylate cyclase